VKVGVGSRSTHLLTVTGRTSGLARTTPVDVIEHAGDRWLVAPYGPVQWVHNTRAAGVVGVRRGRSAETLPATEVDAATGAPVLKAYLAAVPFVRPYFDIGPDAPVEAFEALVPTHPVFRLG
jgi:deazaflavin-dependent oxidoreductase (nitroreductase family)